MARAVYPERTVAFLRDTRPDSLYHPGEDLGNNVAFRVSVYFLAGWSITIFIFCAVITAVPWYSVDFNLGATLPIRNLVSLGRFLGGWAHFHYLFETNDSSTQNW
jgi:hypothetical protein